MFQEVKTDKLQWIFISVISVLFFFLHSIIIKSIWGCTSRASSRVSPYAATRVWSLLSLHDFPPTNYIKIKLYKMAQKIIKKKKSIWIYVFGMFWHFVQTRSNREFDVSNIKRHHVLGLHAIYLLVCKIPFGKQKEYTLVYV